MHFYTATCSHCICNPVILNRQKGCHFCYIKEEISLNFTCNGQPSNRKSRKPQNVWHLSNELDNIQAYFQLSECYGNYWLLMAQLTTVFYFIVHFIILCESRSAVKHIHYPINIVAITYIATLRSFLESISLIGTFVRMISPLHLQRIHQLGRFLFCARWKIDMSIKTEVFSLLEPLTCQTWRTEPEPRKLLVGIHTSKQLTA